MKKVDLTGRRFGKLLVLHETEKIRGRTAFLCRCDCGNEKAVTSSDLQRRIDVIIRLIKIGNIMVEKE